jgi:hypothetical protein
MAVGSYTPVSWQPDELITEYKMDTIGQNMEYLNERSIKGLYNAHNANVRSNLKIAAGVSTIEPDANGVTGKNVYFGGFFTTGCRPIVVGNIVSDSVRRVHLSQVGLGGLWPDHNGMRFIIRVDEYNTDNNAITKAIFVNWIAMGY